jgi:hypothetical protein
MAVALPRWLPAQLDQVALSDAVPTMRAPHS